MAAYLCPITYTTIEHGLFKSAITAISINLTTTTNNKDTTRLNWTKESGRHRQRLSIIVQFVDFD